MKKSSKPLPKWEQFELGVSSNLGDNDFDFFYQFQIFLSQADDHGRRKRRIDYIAAYKGLFLVIDSKAWKDFVAPPAALFAAGRVGYTLKALTKLFWDACLFETQLLRFWDPKCPICERNDTLQGKYLPIKVPKEVPHEGMYAYVNEEGDPIFYLNRFTCKECSFTAETKGFKEPAFTKTQILPTIIPIIVSEKPFQTMSGLRNIYSYVVPARGFCAIMGDIFDSAIVPKRVFLVEHNHLNDFLKDTIRSKRYPDVVTPSLEHLQQHYREKPIDPNRILVNYLLPKRKEHFWLTPGKDAAVKVEELLGTLEEEDFS